MVKKMKWKKFNDWKIQIDIWHVIFAVLFTGMIVIAKHVVNIATDTSSIETAYILDFHWFDIIIFVVLCPLVYLLQEIISVLLAKVEPTVFVEEKKKKWWLVIIFIGFVFLSWIPYLMSYRPGGIYFDTVDSLSMALGERPWDNHNPIAYTLLWRIIFWVTGYFRGESVYKGLNLFTELQCLVLIASLSFFIYRMYCKGMAKKLVVACVLIIAIFPMYPFYGISLWKDTVFSIFVFLYTWLLFEIFYDFKEDITIKDMILFGILSVAIAFFRNNGKYVVLFVSLMIILFDTKHHRKNAIKLGMVGGITTLVCAIILGPIFTGLGFNIDTKTESMGIPIQQVAYIIATDGNLEGTDTEFLDQIMPIEEWKANYNPLCADNLKFNPAFDKMFFEENANTFMKEYIHICFNNPVKVVKAYLLNTLGFWDIFESSGTAYICNFHFSNANYFMSDYFDYNFGYSFSNVVTPKKYMSAAVFVWLMLFTIFECLSKKNDKGIFIILPTLGVWITIMLATPLANSFRYIYALFLCVPIYLLILLQCNKKNDENL